MEQLLEAMSPSTEALKGGGLSENPFRFVFWLDALQILEGGVGSWRAKRSEFEAVKLQSVADLRGLPDPLSQDAERWQEFYKYRAMSEEIAKDVERLLPDQEEAFFSSEGGNDLLSTVLLLWSTQHPIGYRQGMHEVLCLIVLVARRAISAARAVEDDEPAASKDILDALKEAQLESDCYVVFDAIMTQLSPYFEVGKGENAALMALCRRLLEQHLPKVDPEVSHWIVRHGIEPQLFMLRWIRLLFSREFTVDACLCVWDLMWFHLKLRRRFDDIVLDVTTALILSRRGAFIESDANAALMSLMKFPRMDISMLSAVLGVPRCFPGEYSSWSVSSYVPPRPPRPQNTQFRSAAEERQRSRVPASSASKTSRSPKLQNGDSRSRVNRSHSFGEAPEGIDYISDIFREGVTRTWQNINTVSKSLQGHNRGRDEFVVAHLERIADVLYEGTFEGDLLDHRLRNSRARADILQLAQVMKGTMQPGDCTFGPAKPKGKPIGSPSKGGTATRARTAKVVVGLSDPLGALEDPLHSSLRTRTQRVHSRILPRSAKSENSRGSEASRKGSRDQSGIRGRDGSRGARNEPDPAVTYDFGLPEGDSNEDLNWDNLLGQPM